MARVLKRVAAKRDLTDHFVYFAEKADLDIARSFLKACKGSFRLLAQMLELGARRTYKNTQFVNVRAWPVKGFERYLFYRPSGDGVDILRVVHGSMDLDGYSSPRENLVASRYLFRSSRAFARLQ
jgi:toxin ParE1/3/4